MVESLLTDHRPDALKSFHLLAVHLDKSDANMADLNGRIAHFVTTMKERIVTVFVMSLQERAPLLRLDQIRIPVVERLPRSDKAFVLTGWYVNFCIRSALLEMNDRGQREFHIPLDLTLDDKETVSANQFLPPARVDEIVANYFKALRHHPVSHAIYVDGTRKFGEDDAAARTFFYSSAAIWDAWWHVPSEGE